MREEGMDVVVGNNGNVAWLNVAHEVYGNVAHEVRRYGKTKPVASGFIPDVKAGFTSDVVGKRRRRAATLRKTKPVASGFIPDVKSGLVPDVKMGPIPASIGENG